MPQASGWVCVCVTACWRLCRQLVVLSKATAAETSVRYAAALATDRRLMVVCYVQTPVHFLLL